MRREGLIWGLILVTVGAVLLLDNLELINFYWRNIWRFWPVVLIVAGINLIFSRFRSPSGTILIVSITCAILAFFVYAGVKPPVNRSYNRIDRVPRENTGTRNTFTEEFSPGLRKAELNISGGATSYELKDTTSNLFDASVSLAAGRYSLRKISRDNFESLHFGMSERNRSWRGGGEVILKLNPSPVWIINVKMGAGQTDFDLSSFKIEQLNFEGGAASFEVKLGEPDSLTNVTVQSGVANVVISVPRSAGCQIKVKAGLSSREFDGFKKQTDGTYQTTGFNAAVKKVVIDLNGGLSNFEVKRY
jgi:hypothetical protein